MFIEQLNEKKNFDICSQACQTLSLKSLQSYSRKSLQSYNQEEITEERFRGKNHYEPA